MISARTHYYQDARGRWRWQILRGYKILLRGDLSWASRQAAKRDADRAFRDFSEAMQTKRGGATQKR